MAGRGVLEPGEAAAVSALIDAAAEADGVRPLSESAILQLRHDGAGGGHHLLAFAGTGSGPEELAGYARLDPPGPHAAAADRLPVAELAVHPAHRRRGIGRALLAALVDAAGGTAEPGAGTGGRPGRLRVWAHGEGPAARALAASAGFARVRALWLMRRPLSTHPAPLPEPVLPEPVLPEPVLPEPVLPAGVRIRTYDPERDAAAWVELNRRAFAGHPEQGAWTVEDLRGRERQPWFDPAGFFLAVRGDQLIGFHWTKVHERAPHGAAGPIGEVYVVGVDPSARGTGLGRALTVIGQRHLHERGLTAAMLYVDESNTAAVALYESLGFTRWSVDAMYEGPSGTG
jgi:mycothiol synthase